MRAASAIVAGILIALAASCVERDVGPSALPSSASRCSVATAEQIVRQFVDAFDRHDLEATGLTISEGLQWFSVDLDGRHEVAYGKGEAMTYLRSRATAGDSMRLTSLRVTEEPQWDGNLGFQYDLTLVRNQTTYSVSGKGAVSCLVRPGIAVWSMGGFSA